MTLAHVASNRSLARRGPQSRRALLCGERVRDGRLGGATAAEPAVSPCS